MSEKNLKNNKGFALVETLIVAVAVAVIFSIMFMNFFPLVGEYERIEHYNSTDSLYKGYWIRRMIHEDNDTNLFSTTFNQCNGSCRIYGREWDSSDNRWKDHSICTHVEDSDYCNQLLNSMGIMEIIITRNDLTNIKTYASNYMHDNRPMQEFILYLPNFSVDVGDDCHNLRILFSYSRSLRLPGREDFTDRLLFGTIGVRS